MSKILSTLRDSILGKEQDFTSGSINRAIVLLAIPMVIEMSMEGLFALVDAFFVSKVSVDAVATVGMTESVITLIYSIAIGLMGAATAIVARRTGEGDHDGAAKAAVQATIVAVLISLIISVVGVVFADDILRMMGGDERLIAECSGYTKIMFGGNVVIMLIFLLNAVLRGVGSPATAMWVLLIANGVNIVLDPLLIFGIGPFPELGVTGAAIATTIGRGIGVAIQLYVLLRGVNQFKITRKHLVVDMPVIRQILGLASGSTGQYIIASCSWIFLMRIIAESGSEAVAGYTIAIRILVFTIMPAWGFSNAAATLVGQNLGAGKPERAEKSVWLTAHYDMLFMLLMSIIFYFAAPHLVPMFNSTPGVVEAGILSLRIFLAGYIFFAYGMVISQAFNGAGDTKTPTIINFICFWMIEIPLGYFMAITLGLKLEGVCWAVFIAETIMALMLIYLFRKGKWKEIKI